MTDITGWVLLMIYPQEKNAKLAPQSWQILILTQRLTCLLFLPKNFNQIT